MASLHDNQPVCSTFPPQEPGTLREHVPSGQVIKAVIVRGMSDQLHAEKRASAALDGLYVALQTLDRRLQNGAAR